MLAVIVAFALCDVQMMPALPPMRVLFRMLTEFDPISRMANVLINWVLIAAENALVMLDEFCSINMLGELVTSIPIAAFVSVLLDIVPAELAI